MIRFDADLKVQEAQPYEDGQRIEGLAVHGDILILLIVPNHQSERPALQLLDITQFPLNVPQKHRLVELPECTNPSAVAAACGNAYVFDEFKDGDKEHACLHVIDLESGMPLQQIRWHSAWALSRLGTVTAMLVDGNEIYLADHAGSSVLGLAGSGPA